MSHKCPGCARTFSAQQALCEDWRDPKKSFGCPHCGHFIYKDLRPNIRQSVAVGIMAGGIATPAVMLLGRGILGGDGLSLLYGAIILISCVAVLLVSLWGSRA